MSGFLTADAVAAVLAFFPKDTFESTSTELQAGFREIALQYPDLFGQISFGKTGAYVWSPTIDAALDSLAASRFYSRYNKDLVTYELNKTKLQSYFDNFLYDRFHEAGITTDTIETASCALMDILRDIHTSSDRKRLLVVS
jgi:hypothetical protein